MASALTLHDKSLARPEVFGNAFSGFLSLLAERNQSLTHAHAQLADRIERLIEQDELKAPPAKMLRTALRSVARRNRREAQQHLSVALRTHRLLGRRGADFDVADVAACFDTEGLQ